MKKKNGFTLIELLISVTLISVVIIFLFQLLNNIQNEEKMPKYIKSNQINRYEIMRTIGLEASEKGVCASNLSKNTNNSVITLSFCDGVSMMSITVSKNQLTIEQTGTVNKKYSYKFTDKNAWYDFQNIEFSTGSYMNFNYSKYVIKTEKKGMKSNTIDDIEIYFSKEILTGAYSEFAYTGGEQTFVIPETGYYQLEVWGAQGGDAKDGTTTTTGGYGGYSTGVAYLKKGTTLYINVGGKGASVGGTNAQAAGGYNGGGTAKTVYKIDIYGGSGGGATHIAFSSGLLSSFENNKDSVLIVGGGGGGAAFHSAGNLGEGGAGGGYIGANGTTKYTKYGTGATQTAPGYFSGDDTLGRGSFGKGGTTATSNSTDYYGGAGGGGWYGGGASSSSYTNGGGGGSGYIANPLLISTKYIRKQMVCYNCKTSTDKNTYTMSVSNCGSTPTANTPKWGDGYARISKVLDDVYNFYYEDGNASTFIAPESSYYEVELWGAQGGSVGSEVGGNGAYTKGMIYLKKGEKIYIYVGGKGSSDSTLVQNDGGYNGGGVSGISSSASRSHGGGGSTDVRLVGGDALDFDSLKSRIMVAAGGGGGADKATGGYGGKLTGYNGVGASNFPDLANGGTQTSGGTGRATSTDRVGKFGKGAPGSTTQSDGWGGGGGSGYYGGAQGFGTGGGGGSSFISGYDGCDAISEDSTESNIIHTGQSVHYSGYIFINAEMLDGNTQMPSPTNGNVGVMKGNPGNGHARITKVANKLFEYDYTGKIETFSAPNAGKYRLDVWGAQGGSTPNATGGVGSYSSGIIYLDKNEKLYVVVGGKGADAKELSKSYTGGYNGGGPSRADGSTYFAPGGGATHIATSSGLLSKVSSSNVVIVAGGGGGAGQIGTNYNNGGNAGGKEGLAGTGSCPGSYGTQGAGGAGCKDYSWLTYSGSYGQGSGGNYDSSGGGGGYYGGGNGYTMGSSGGGGSGYIGHASLTDGMMYCKGCKTSGTASTKTMSTSISSPYHVTRAAKEGNGFALITFLG